MVEDIRNKGLTKEEITKLLKKLGEHYGYITETEVNTGFSKVDVVWFNEKVKSLWINRNKMLENSLAIPSVGFEIEERTFSRKPIRGEFDILYPKLQPPKNVCPMCGHVFKDEKFLKRHLIYEHKAHT